MKRTHVSFTSPPTKKARQQVESHSSSEELENASDNLLYSSDDRENSSAELATASNEQVAPAPTEVELHITQAIQTLCPSWTRPGKSEAEPAFRADNWKCLQSYAATNKYSVHQAHAASTTTDDTWPLAASVLISEMPWQQTYIGASYHYDQTKALQKIQWAQIHTCLPLDQLQAHALVYSSAAQSYHRCLHPHPGAAIFKERLAKELQRTAALLKELAQAWLKQELCPEHLWLTQTVVRQELHNDLTKRITQLHLCLQLKLFCQIAVCMNTTKKAK